MKESYVQLEAVKDALDKFVKDDVTIKKVLELLNAEILKIDNSPIEAAPDETVEEGDGEPKKKNQFVVVVSDPNETITQALAGWVLQIPEDEDAQAVVENIKKAAYNFNASKKGQKHPVSSIGQAIGDVSSKFFRPYYVKIKTKEPVQVIVTDNKLPKS